MSRSPDYEPGEGIEGEVVEEASAVALPEPTVPTAPVTSNALAVDYTDDGVPTFDYVRDQIEGRLATSVGAAELVADTPRAASVDEEFAAREQAGRDRLEQIRRAMRKE
jgi:phage shock protein A